MYVLKRYQVRQVGKWDTDIEDPDKYNFFTLRQARSVCAELNHKVEMLDLHFKYQIFDMFDGSVVN
jgi:hypothetical protein